MKIDFENTSVAFHANTNRDLKQAYLLFKSMNYGGLVQFLKYCVNICLALHLPIKGIIKATIFRQFCGGETIAGCDAQIERLAKENVYSILDYSSEGKETEEALDFTMNTTIETIKNAKGNANIPFAVFKPTGIGRVKLYEKVSLGRELTAAEKEEWEKVRVRYYNISQHAFDANIPLLIDAEETYIQKAIDDLCDELMIKYNQQSAIIWNTCQMYRWDRLDYIKEAVAKAKAGNYFYGLKIVRGAYMEKERARAEEKGYQDPIQKNKEATDKDFDLALEFLIENHETCSVMVATHNANSSQKMVDVMQRVGLKNNDQHVHLSQLFGMSDNLSMNIAKEGFNVEKYLPFGPIEDVMPYLFRRAEENTSVKGQSSRELTLIEMELKRRRKK